MSLKFPLNKRILACSVMDWNLLIPELMCVWHRTSQILHVCRLPRRSRYGRKFTLFLSTEYKYKKGRCWLKECICVSVKKAQPGIKISVGVVLECQKSLGHFQGLCVRAQKVNPLASVLYCLRHKENLVPGGFWWIWMLWEQLPFKFEFF